MHAGTPNAYPDCSGISLGQIKAAGIKPPDQARVPTQSHSTRSSEPDRQIPKKAEALGQARWATQRRREA